MEEDKSMGSLADRIEQSKAQFKREVLPQELSYVKSRWREVYGRRRQADALKARETRLEQAQEAAGEAAGSAAPAAGNGLVGLAFSGGGIRSATLNLGIAQALHRRGVLDHVDYLSTVSGGGYLGSSLSTVMRDGAEFPYEAREGPRESPYLTWLRNHSNYLAERGFLDYARIVAVLLRGVLINFFVLIPFLLLLSLGYTVWFDKAGGTFFQGDWSQTLPITRWGLAFALFYMLAFPVVVRVFKVLSYERSKKMRVTQTAAAPSESSVKSRDRFERTFSAVLLAVVGLAVLEALPVILYYFHKLSTHGVARGVSASVAGGSSVIALAVVGKLMEHFKGFARTLVIWLVGLLGLLLPLLVVLHVSEGLVWSWHRVAEPFWAIPGIFAALIIGGFLASGTARLSKNTIAVTLVGLAGILGTLAAVLGAAFLGALDAVAPWQFILALSVVTWLFCWLSVDVNLTSIHGFYRDRLAAAYLVGIDTDRRRGSTLDQIQLADIDIEEDLNLQDICQGERPGEHPSIAPYHLVNVAHNLQKSKDPGIRERNADFFIFSKRFYGGNRTGYCSTDNLEAVFPQMDLATAMAISAAAASPNMGSGTIGSLVAVMTLFNIRLGYWVPNPAHLLPWAKKKGEPIRGTIWRRFAWRIRPAEFIKEMVSSLDETSKWINLSDGGHIENLAVYELLRRRCKYIIAGDGEADPALNFNSLAKLKRYARIDLGIEIEILLDDVRRDAAGISHQHCACGRILYPEVGADGKQETGYLLYIKSSVTGDEDEVIRQYRARNPAFPHESTADQFFDEGQFEAYRALGFHIADGLFEVDHTVGDFAAFEAWFEEQSMNLAPSLAAETLLLELQSELSAIQGLLQEPSYAHYFYDLYPDLRPADFQPPAAGSRQAADQMRGNIYLVGKQLRLMENVFVSLDLDRPRNRGHAGNRGWMRLFQQWAEAWRRDPSLIAAYQTEARLHNWKLREFCTGVLDLPVPEEGKPIARSA
jgi:Patatin-like phospholipase